VVVFLLSLTDWGSKGRFVSAKSGSGGVFGADRAARCGEIRIVRGGEGSDMLLIPGLGLLTAGLLTRAKRIHLRGAIGVLLALPPTSAPSGTSKKASRSLANSLDSC
jgi:hypothetical protein